VYGSLGVPELREVRQLRNENRRLKGLVADLTLDKNMLQEALRKMVTPAQRRELAAWGIAAYQVPERRSCSVFGVCRSTLRYKNSKPNQKPLRLRLRELSAARVRAGYQWLHVY
jgi:putative transposase